GFEDGLTEVHEAGAVVRVVALAAVGQRVLVKALALGGVVAFEQRRLLDQVHRHAAVAQRRAPQRAGDGAVAQRDVQGQAGGRGRRRWTRRAFGSNGDRTSSITGPVPIAAERSYCLRVTTTLWAIRRTSPCTSGWLPGSSRAATVAPPADCRIT